MNVLKHLSRWQKLSPGFFVLLLGLLHGVFYLFLVPPWQHYDEPTQFEYAWLIANQRKLPGREAYDSEMRREVTASMVEHGFFDTLAPPNLLLDKTWIGISQTSDQPLYYLISAIPLSLFRGAEATFQLYIIRVVSLCIFLLTLYVSYRLSIEIFPQNKQLHWMLPTSIALTPGFVDLMTAVNNDVGATLMFSLFLWAGTRVILKGIAAGRVIALLILSIACYYTKNTVLMALALAVFLLLLLIFQAPPPWNRLAIPVIGICVGVAGVYFFSWRDAAFWYRSQLSVQQTMSTRGQKDETAHDGYFLQIHFEPGEKNEQNLAQPLTLSARDTLAGKNYTLGAWVWASEPVQAQMPTLLIDGRVSFQTILLQESPTFFALTGTISQDAKQIHLIIDPLAVPLDHPITIYLDNLILVEGKYSLENTPVLPDDSTIGTWGNKVFTNLIRNSTMDKNWVTFNPSVLLQFRNQTSIPVYALPAIQDFELTGLYYRNTAKNLFESFWARFGWNHIALPQWAYLPLSGFSLIGILGGVIGLFSLNAKREFRFTLLAIWFATCTYLIWIAAFARQTLPFWDALVFTPSARYAYPAIIPTSLFIAGGWYYILTRTSKTKLLAYLPIVFLLILDITSLIVIYQFYYSG